MWPDLKKPSFPTHNIKLTISPVMDYWLNTLSYSTCGLLQSQASGFLDPQVALCWHHLMVMALLYWCLESWKSHKGLANVCYLQFGVLWAQERSSRAPKLDLWFSVDFVFHFVLLYWAHPPPPTPITTTCNIITVTKKVLKNSLNFGCFKLLTHTIIAKERQVLAVIFISSA